MGKSEFATELALRINGEIVGADAFQIYSGLLVLTAQPEVGQPVPSHMVGCVGVREAYHVQRYRLDATRCIEDILQRGKVPVVVGGTGLYFRALIQGLDVLPPSDPLLRHELGQLSLSALLKRLNRADPTAGERIDIRNPRRVLRAIEICELSGRPLRDFWSLKGPIAARCGLFLMREREELDGRILANVNRMWERGVVREVEKIRYRVGPTASRAIGFHEILALLDGRITETQCRQAIYVETRRYSKRQLTWFRNQTRFALLNLSVFSSTQAAVSSALASLGVASSFTAIADADSPIPQSKQQGVPYNRNPLT